MAVEEAEAADGRSSRVDWRAAGEGALWTLAIILPPVALVLMMKSDDLAGEESNLWLLTPVALLVGFGVGGFLAGRRRPEMPLLHAATAGGLAFGAVATMALLRRLATGDGVTFASLANLLLLAVICVSASLWGGYVAARRTSRRR